MSRSTKHADAENGEVPASTPEAGHGESPPAPSLLEHAAGLAAEGNLAEAADLYARMATEDGNNVPVLLALAATLVQLGRYEGAERELRRALRLAPDAAEVHSQLGVALYKRGNYAAAVAELRRAVELGPSGPTYLVLGEALNQMSEPDAAIAALEQATLLQPENGRAFYAMGIAYDRKGHFERAAEMYRLSREAGSRMPARP